jgi:hypothetical protein
MADEERENLREGTSRMRSTALRRVVRAMEQPSRQGQIHMASRWAWAMR